MFALGLSLFAKELTHLLTSEQAYRDAWLIVPIITFSYVQHGLGYFLNWGVVLRNRSLLSSLNLTVAAVINILLCAAVIPWGGAIGAAAATLISYLVWNGLKAFYSARLHDLRFDWRRIGLATLLALVLLPLGLHGLGLHSWGILGWKACLLVSYPMFLLATHYFSGSDRELMQQAAAGLWRAIQTRRGQKTPAELFPS
jgi:O-antigen/teichoic acid export membrane protein